MLLSLPIDVVLVPVEGENLVGPAPRPSHALTEPCRLLRRTDPPFRSQPEVGLELRQADRKSTRLNSSHLVISYAVFCLKKKKKNTQRLRVRHKTGLESFIHRFSSRPCNE